MRVIEISGGTGPADFLRVGERNTPVVSSGEVRIRVHAAGVNRPDLLQRQGHYPAPAGASDILGLEVAGIVDQVGEGVTNRKVGDRVCALLGGGGYADYAVVDARHTLFVPADMAMTQAAALPETVFTVFANVFEAGQLAAGETLLVHGATSGIGVTAIQMAKATGAKVIATSRGAEKTAAAADLGADLSLDATRDDLMKSITQAGGADVVLDMLGADYAALNLASLKSGGRWVVIASLTGAEAQINLLKIMLKRIQLTGSTLRSRHPDEKARLAQAIQKQVWPWVVAGLVRPPVAAVFPLEHADRAHRKLEDGQVVGKIVLNLQP